MLEIKTKLYLIKLTRLIQNQSCWLLSINPLTNYLINIFIIYFQFVKFENFKQCKLAMESHGSQTISPHGLLNFQQLQALLHGYIQYIELKGMTTSWLVSWYHSNFQSLVVGACLDSSTNCITARYLIIGASCAYVTSVNVEIMPRGCLFC